MPTECSENRHTDREVHRGNKLLYIKNAGYDFKTMFWYKERNCF